MKSTFPIVNCCVNIAACLKTWCTCLERKKKADHLVWSRHNLVELVQRSQALPAHVEVNGTATWSTSAPGPSAVVPCASFSLQTHESAATTLLNREGHRPELWVDWFAFTTSMIYLHNLHWFFVYLFSVNYNGQAKCTIFIQLCL